MGERRVRRVGTQGPPETNFVSDADFVARLRRYCRSRRAKKERRKEARRLDAEAAREARGRAELMTPKEHVERLIHVEADDRSFGGRFFGVWCGYTMLDYEADEQAALSRAGVLRREILPCVEAAVADALASPVAAPVTLTTPEQRAALRGWVDSRNSEQQAPSSGPGPFTLRERFDFFDPSALLDELDWLHAVVRDIGQDDRVAVYEAGRKAERERILAAVKERLTAAALAGVASGNLRGVAEFLKGGHAAAIAAVIIEEGGP